jgi:hypothetical protein
MQWHCASTSRHRGVADFDEHGVYWILHLSPGPPGMDSDLAGEPVRSLAIDGAPVIVVLNLCEGIRITGE